MSALAIDRVRTDISPDDTMFEGDRDHYFSVGRSALECIRLAMSAGSIPTFRNILDFGCGFGRVMRVLRAAFPGAEIAACDVDRRAVDYCSETFDAEPLYSDENPAYIRIPRAFNLIWCGTLLTNVAAPQFIRFLELLHSSLLPGGLLVFTAHGPFVAERIRSRQCTYGLDEAAVPDLLQEYDAAGFGYLNYSGDVLARLHLSRYGISVCRPSWILERIEQLPHSRVLMYTERAWDNHQDSIAFLRG